MPKAGLTAVQYRNQIVKVIRRIGPRKALAHKDYGIMYSGPADGHATIIGWFRRNSAKSKEQAHRLGGSRVNDTWIADKLITIDLFRYFEQVYKPLACTTKLGDVLQGTYNTVWGGVSAEFAKLPFNEIATAVCGAGKKQVFYRYELPQLVSNTHIDACNEIPMESVRSMYNHVSKDEAFNLICLSELQMAFRYAYTTNTAPVHAWHDFVERVNFYNTERNVTASTKKPLTNIQEQQKQQIIVRFGLNSLYARKPSTWGGPLVPHPKHPPIHTSKPNAGYAITK